MNHALRHQRTLARPARVDGFGYWSGKDVSVEFRPAPADHGIVFVRGDLAPPVVIPADASHRKEALRRTSLAASGCSVEMVEHILAALAGLGVDNCQVWADAAEMPGCDGSSLPFVQAIDAAGLVPLDAPQTPLVVAAVHRIEDEEGWIEARPHSRPGLSLRYELDYSDHGAIGRQAMDLEVRPESFRRELAPARTFLLEEEAQWLQSRGLGARVTYRDLLVFDQQGPRENSLRFPNECVRHKALDLVGDLALAGRPLAGRIVACRSGHRHNGELIRAILEEEGNSRARRRTA